jgi:hypothetical protein
MSGVVVPDGTPGTLPTGSSASDADYPIAPGLLSLLSQSASGSLLAVSTIGAATASRIASTLALVESFTALEAYRIDAGAIDGLADQSTSQALSANASSLSNRVTVIVWLASVNPTSVTPFVRLTNGPTFYDLAVPAGQKAKRLEFRNLPATFTNGFYIFNGLGVPFASFGNAIVTHAS